MHTAPAAVTRYQAQLQEQQQEVPAPAAAPAGSTPATPPPASAPAEESTDSIIGDILKKPPPPRDQSGDGDGDAGPPVPDEDEPDPGDGGEGDEEPGGDADPGQDEDEELTDPATPDTLRAARKALAEGNLDEAFRLAFGKKPEELQPDTKAWTAWRKANDRVQAQIERDRRAVATELQQGQQWVAEQRKQLQGVIEQLRPYEKAHQARLAFKQTGDPSYLKQLVVEVAEVPWDDALKAIVTKTRLSPGERALQQQVQTLQQRLEEAERKKAEEAQQQTQRQVYEQDLTTIRGALAGEITQVPRFAERVYQVLLKTRSATGGLTLTIEQAGRQVLAAERRKLAEHPLLKKAGKPKPPAEVSRAASTLARSRPPKPPASSPPLRRDSHGNGATDEATESTDDIIADILKSNNRRRVAV